MIAVGPVDTAPPAKAGPAVELVLPIIAEAAALDKAVARQVTLLRSPTVPGGRLVVAPTGLLGRDFDDVRRYADAARAGVERAVAAGARELLLVVIPPSPRPPQPELYARCREVALVAALAAGYVPLECREDIKGTSALAGHPLRFGSVGLYAPKAHQLDHNVSQVARALESGRAVARDIGGSDPERMAPPVGGSAGGGGLCCADAMPSTPPPLPPPHPHPPKQRVAEYVTRLFAGSAVGVAVEEDPGTLLRAYPLLHGLCSYSQSLCHQ